MKSSSRNMKGYKSVAEARLLDFERWLTSADWWTLGLKDAGGLYEKKVVGGSYCRVRLDRALACAEWNVRFPLTYVRHLTSAASDHGPIELRWDIRPQRSSDRRGKRQFGMSSCGKDIQISGMCLHKLGLTNRGRWT